MTPSTSHEQPVEGVAATSPQTITHVRDLSSDQWKWGIAAWLGWLFDGLDMHLYTLIATPFVAELLALAQTDKQVGRYSSLIQGAFLVGWALGGGFFGQVGDRLGRGRALTLTILTYSVFTGLSFFAHSWWDLMIYRFLAALGIGGEWAVGAALLSETWPRQWRPWLAAILQSGVNVGVMVAMVAGMLVTSYFPNRFVFLIGVLPALMVVWIRREVRETDEWVAAKGMADRVEPGIGDLFRGSVRKITLLTILVCAFSLTAHWAFMFWYLQHLRSLPDLAEWTEAAKTALASRAMIIVMVGSVVGNFLAALIARSIGYRRTIVLMCLGYCGSIVFTYSIPRSHTELLYCFGMMGVLQGVFALFTMYLPPLFPTLMRTTGAGFCYNIGRLAAAGGTVFFGLFSKVGDYRMALLYTGILFVPASAFAMFLPEAAAEPGPASPLE